MDAYSKRVMSDLLLRSGETVSSLMETIDNLRSKKDEYKKAARRLLDQHEYCPSCNMQTAGRYGHADDCPDWLLLYGDLEDEQV